MEDRNGCQGRREGFLVVQPVGHQCLGNPNAQYKNGALNLKLDDPHSTSNGSRGVRVGFYSISSKQAPLYSSEVGARHPAPNAYSRARACTQLFPTLPRIDNTSQPTSSWRRPCRLQTERKGQVSGPFAVDGRTDGCRDARVLSAELQCHQKGTYDSGPDLWDPVYRIESHCTRATKPPSHQCRW